MVENDKQAASSSAVPDDEPVVEEFTKDAKSEGKNFLARALRWLLVLAVIFGLGALLILFLLFIPARDQAIAAQQQIRAMEEQAQADLEMSEERIVELENIIEDLSTLEAQNEDLQEELADTDLHVVILSARSDVTTAQLILVKEDDASKARITLSRTSETLNMLEEMLEPDQRKLAADMQERLKLVLEELEDNPYAAESDLDVLARGLLELESALFTAP